MGSPMDRSRHSTTCRCGYSSPATHLRCLGCGRRLQRCERPVERRARAATPARPQQVVQPIAPAAPPRPVAPEPPAFSGRDAARFGAAPTPAEPMSVPIGPLAVAGLVAAAWVGPEAPRAELLTAAALLGAALSARRVVPAATAEDDDVVAPARPTHLTDDELRDAVAAW